MLLMPPSSTIQDLKEEVATALNDTSDPLREVKAGDITVYKQTHGEWRELDEEKTVGKRGREPTIEELGIRGIGSGSVIDGDVETLAYTVKNGLKSEEIIEMEAYPQDD